MAPADLQPTRLGAHLDGDGVDFRLFSRHAERVELCLFGAHQDAGEIARVDLERESEELWSTHLSALGPGERYGYRVHGPWDPGAGHRYNPAKLLVDPYARALTGELSVGSAIFGHTAANPASADTADSATSVPLCVVTDPAFDWQGDRAPAVPWDESLIYECHVRGMTRLQPKVPEALRGTYLGLAQEPVIGHLQSLGVTAVELLPVQHFVSEPHLEDAGLTNYFGYNPLALFAPHAAYAVDPRRSAVDDFKTMVRELHRAGIEVLLDVVFNHTAEGNHLGPTLSLRGIDNSTYYRLEQDDRSLYEDYSGCGNTLNVEHPRVAAMVVDCLRYWVDEMHVDGFRFDLATSLGRTGGEFRRSADLLTHISEDPLLQGVKLIAEPWDLGPHGYRSGDFPDRWAEWNDRFRNTARAFWRGDAVSPAELADRMAGSPSLYAPRRGAQAGVNFVTCHDGFTLTDLVSYAEKNNWANGEDNRDGSDHNLSRNWGTEGPTSLPGVVTLRERVKRGLLATLALAQGVPMLSHGDELARTQLGNNNAYCHDTDLTWVDWHLDVAKSELLVFCRQLFERRRAMFDPRGELQAATVMWLGPDGYPLREPRLHDRSATLLGHLRRSTAAAHLVVFNRGEGARLFQLPALGESGSWTRMLSTARPGIRPLATSRSVRIMPHTLLLLEWRP